MTDQRTAGNMMMARLFAATVLMIPKYGADLLSLPALFGIYGILFIGSGGFILWALIQPSFFVKRHPALDKLG